jgi:hypothetical protein
LDDPARAPPATSAEAVLNNLGEVNDKPSLDHWRIGHLS